MGLFNKFEKPADNNETMVKRAESEVDILSAELQKKDWVEIWNSLCCSELNSPAIVEKMSSEAQEKFKQAIIEAKNLFETDKVNIREDLVAPIQEFLEKM
jgi:hypothetical protein